MGVAQRHIAAKLLFVVSHVAERSGVYLPERYSTPYLTTNLKRNEKRESQVEQMLILSSDFVEIHESVRPDSESREILILSRQSRKLCTISYFPIFIGGRHYAEEELHVPVESVFLEDGKLFLEGSVSNDAGTQWQIGDEIAIEGNLISIRRRWKYRGERLGGVRLGFDLPSELNDLDYWMIPGLMYNGNPGAQCQPTGMVKDGEPWCFREERTTVPSCIILESGKDVVGAFTEPSRDEDCLSFCSLIPSEEGHMIRIGFPFLEAPLIYMGDLDDDRELYVKKSWLAGKSFVVENGDSFERTFYVVVDKSAETSHGYIKILDRAWDTISDETTSCYDLDDLHKICWQAISYHWYEDDKVSGYSTRISNKGHPEKSHSPNITAGWCGVAFMMGYLLLKEFMNTGDKELLSKATSIAASYVNYSGLPNGMYLTHYNLVKRAFIYQACTTLQMAEGVYWLLKMNELMSEIETRDEDWDDFAREFCDFLVRSQLPGGSFGEKWSPYGELISDYRSGGVYAVATLAEAFKAFGEREYLESAERGARYYIDFCVDKEYNYGICVDQLDTTVEMDGNDAVVFALLEIYDVTKKAIYLEKAIKAAEFGVSFQYVYHVAFSSHCDAGKYNLDTRGGALITNQTPVVCHWVAWAALGFLRIWEHTGDKRWCERAVSAIKHTTHLITTEGETFGCASHLIGCREEVLAVVDLVKGGVFKKKGMVEIVDFEPVFWPAAFNLLNIIMIREKYPTVSSMIM